MSRRILFVGGQIVLPDRVVDGSLLVENEKIVGILEPEIQTHIENCEIVDVTGKTLLPGLIDTHVHMWIHPPSIIGKIGTMGQDVLLLAGLLQWSICH